MAPRCAAQAPTAPYRYSYEYSSRLYRTRTVPVPDFQKIYTTVNCNR